VGMQESMKPVGGYLKNWVKLFDVLVKLIRNKRRYRFSVSEERSEISVRIIRELYWQLRDKMDNFFKKHKDLRLLKKK
jgi:hypothetical protein